MDKLYAVVKHAGPTWSHYWVNNPKDGVCSCNSAAWTHTGKSEEIQPTYDDPVAAEIDAARLNKANPVGDYGVCPIINKGCSICPIDDDEDCDADSSGL